MKKCKSKTVATVLAFVLGALGAHNFYLGNVSLGTGKLVATLVFNFLASWIPLIGGIFRVVPFAIWLWGILDGIYLVTGRTSRDYHGNEII